MCSSASVSSSSVVMPGRTDRRSSSRVSPTTRPAARIVSTCAGVLISTPRSRNTRRRLGGAGAVELAEHAEHPGRHLVDRPHAVDPHEQAALLVDLDERGGLLGVHLLAVPEDVLRVVGATLLGGALG